MKREMTIAREASISLGGFAFAQAVRFGFNLAAARLLGVEALGIYALVVALVQTAETLAAGGYDTGLLRFVTLREGEARRHLIASALKRTLVAAVLIGALVVMFSGALTGMLHGGHLLQLTLCSAALALPFTVVTGISSFAAQAHRHLLPKVIATQMIFPAGFLCTMLFARFTFGREPALVLPFLIAPLLAFMWIISRFGRVTGVGFADVFRAGGDRELAHFARPLLLVSLLTMLSHWIDIVMLGLLTDVHSVGIYQPAARTAGLLRSVLLAFAGIAAPMIAGYHGRGDRKGVSDTYGMVTRWILTIVIVPCLVFVLFPVEALSIFGKGFGAGSGAMIMLTITMLLNAWLGLGGTVLAMCGKERLSLFNQAGALVLQVLLHWLLIPRMGIDGAALSTLVVMVLLTVVRMIELRFLLGIPFFSFRLWKPLVAGLVSALAMLLVRQVAAGTLHSLQLMAAATGTGAAVYFLLIRLFGLEREEMEVILKIMPFLNPQSKTIAP
jgi:O-antigen/teichoic acid export membrane protein